MRKTTLLGLPIYDNPSQDKFKLNDWNVANEKIDKTYGEVLEFREKIPTVNANAELIEARQGEATLGKKIISIDTQLEQSQNELNVLKPKVDSLSSGSPKGTFTTLSALQSNTDANTINGRKSIYVVTADGNWYYWNGTSWVSGGLYQSSGISDTATINRITLDGTQNSKFLTGSLSATGVVSLVTSSSTRIVTSEFIQFSEDVYIYTDVGYQFVYCKYTSNSESAFTLNSGWLTSKKIPYEVGVYYKFSIKKDDDTKLNFYDSSKIHFLTNKIFATDIFDNINSINRNLKYEDDIEFEQGTISAGKYVASTTNLYTPNFIKFNDDLEIIAKSGYKVIVVLYTSNNEDSYISASTEFTNQVIKPNSNLYCRFIIKREDGLKISKKEKISVSFSSGKGVLIKEKVKNLFNISKDAYVDKIVSGVCREGVYQESQNRLTIPEFIQIDNKLKVYADNGYKVAYTKNSSNKDGSQTYDSGWSQQYEITTEVGAYYRFNFKRDDDSFIVADEKCNFHFETSDFEDIVTKVDSFKKADNNIYYPFQSNLIPSKTRYVLHRGALTIAPENTIPAFEKAGQLGVWGVETDISTTLDGELVCFHDSDISRMTNGIGNIQEINYSDLQSLIIDSGNGISNYPNLKVPKFTDYLKVCKKYGCIPVIELKNIKFSDISKVTTILEEFGYENSCVIASQSFGFLNKVRDLNKYIHLAYYVNSLTEANIEGVRKLKNSSIWTNAIDLALIKNAHKNKLTVGAWTYDTQIDKANLIENNIDIIMTNVIN